MDGSREDCPVVHDGRVRRRTARSLGVRHLALLATIFLASIVWAPRELAAAPAAPRVEEQIVATFVGGALTLTGEHLGETPSSRIIRFHYGARSSSVSADSPLVQIWQDDMVRLSLPPEVGSGQLTVTVDGAAGEPVDLLVYSYEPVAIPPSAGITKHEIAVAVDANGAVWINQEGHRELKSFSPDAPPEYEAFEIPQAAGPGIFAYWHDPERRSRLSHLGEDVDVASDGKVWMTEGGALLYGGPLFNTSRIVAYDPEADSFECYNVPTDNAAVNGVLVDEERGVVWYSEGALADGNAISGFVPGEMLSDCFFDPYGDGPRVPVCSDGLTSSCHVRFTLPQPFSLPGHLALDPDGNIWFTEFWGNRVGRLTPETGEIVELPLPPRIATDGPGLWFGGGPWELAFDEQGDLWVGESFDVTVVRVRPSVMESEDCLHLDANGQNPCIEEVFVPAEGPSGMALHTVFVGAGGFVWFGVMYLGEEHMTTDRASIGFVSHAHGDTVAFLPTMEGLDSANGIVQDPVTNDLWIVQGFDNKLARLRLVGLGDRDRDGVVDDEDNCVLVPNPGQEDFNLVGPGDACDDLDSDGDGCPDARELGPDETLGGRRDPHNPWDFYDIDGNGVVDLYNDLLTVAYAYGQGAEDPTYDPSLDRSPPPPPHEEPDPSRREPWDLGPPAGGIDLFTDIFGVGLQYGHTCREAGM